MLSFWRQENPEETPQRLEQLGAGTGAADIEYEQFLKAKEASLSMSIHLGPQGAGGHSCGDVDKYFLQSLSMTKVSC